MTQSTDRPDLSGTPESPLPAEPAERGFTLMVAILVMALLSTLGLTLMFTSETERAITRNFSGTIQASYAAEAVLDPMISALIYDLQNDSRHGWRNRYMVVCNLADEIDCRDNRIGIKPTDAPCYTAGMSSGSCIVQDPDGTLTGKIGQWAVDLAWRPSTIAQETTYPRAFPLRLYRDPKDRAALPDDLRSVLPWWTKFDVDAGNRSHLYNNVRIPRATDPAGVADIAILPVCTAANGNCPTITDYAKDEVMVTGIGASPTRLGTHFSRLSNPSTRAATVRVKGNLIGVFDNALVGGQGSGNNTTDPVVKGDYLVRGGVLIFNSDETREVLKFSAKNTGIYNNYYQSVDPGDLANTLPTIDPWWWSSARGCRVTGAGSENGQPQNCDSNNTTLSPVAGKGLDSDSVTTTATQEPIQHHLPDPPLPNPATNPPPLRGGYRGDRTVPDAHFPGPETLNAIVRVRTGKIIIDHTNASFGRSPQGNLSANLPTTYWDNIRNLYTDATFAGSFLNQHYRYDDKNNLPPVLSQSTWNATDKAGGFDVDPASLKFPKLTDPYDEPQTGVRYTNYKDFMRATIDPANKPGGWALDLSDIDGEYASGASRTNLTMGVNGKCWPYRGATTATNEPSQATLEAAFPATTPGKVLRNLTVISCLKDYLLDTSPTGTTCLATDPTPRCVQSCVIRLTCNNNGTGGPACGSVPCPTAIEIPIYGRTETGLPGVSNELNFDTSSSLNSPNGRAQATMFNSFAYKLYVDVREAVDRCDSTKSTLYNNNLATLPSAFAGSIPTSYPGNSPQECYIDTTVGGVPSPCFIERSAYMDVHVQLSDTPTTNTSDQRYNGYLPAARWFSVRFRPNQPAPTVLADPRAGGPCSRVSASIPTGNPEPSSDLAFEVQETDSAAAGIVWPWRLGNSAVGGYLNWRTLLAVPDDYDRARPLDPRDTQFRNMPTGAFVVALHLPCSTSLTDANPYKCSTITPTPAISYPGFYTHLIGWAPKYTCWRGAGNDWRLTTTSLPGVPALPDSYACTAAPSSACPANQYSWAKQSLWVANTTTLFNTPKLYDKGTPDLSSFRLGADLLTMGGFHLMIPMEAPTDGGDRMPCSAGLDFNYRALSSCAGVPGVIKGYNPCNADNDGIRCNGNVGPNDSATSWTTPGNVGLGCATYHDCLSNNANTCNNEPDFVPPDPSQAYDANKDYDYGGCTEIFTPLVSNRILELNPAWTGPGVAQPSTPGNPVNYGYTRNENTLGPGSYPYASPAVVCSSPCTCAGACVAGFTNRACVYPGIDPDKFGGTGTVTATGNNSWPPYTTNFTATRVGLGRYFRGWPGFGSVDVLEGTGLVFTRDKVRFGSPKRPVPTPPAADYLGVCSPDTNPTTECPAGIPATDCYNCADTIPNYHMLAPGSPTNGIGDQTLDYRGQFSEPIIYDGRLILYAFDAAADPNVPATQTTRVFYHDTVVPRGRMGCSDFMNVLTNGNAEIDLQMSSVGVAIPKHMLALFNVTQGKLSVVTADKAVQTELVGSWIADAADFGTAWTNSPVQIIGTPSIVSDKCDAIYMPGRVPIAQRQILSFVEDDTIPPGF